MPGMYAVTSMPFERRTRAILRSAEFGFFGVIVRTTVQTPRFCGAPFESFVWRPLGEFQVVRRAGVSTFFFCDFRPLRTSCEIVGTVSPTPLTRAHANTHESDLSAIGLPPSEEPLLAESVPGRS